MHMNYLFLRKSHFHAVLFSPFPFHLLFIITNYIIFNFRTILVSQFVQKNVKKNVKITRVAKITRFNSKSEQNVTFPLITIYMYTSSQNIKYSFF